MNGWWVLGGLVAFYSVAWLCQIFYHLGWQHADKFYKRQIDFLEAKLPKPCDRDYI